MTLAAELFYVATGRDLPPRKEAVSTYHARVVGLSGDAPADKPTMVLRLKGAIWPCDLLRLPRQEGIELGDSFVVILSKIEVPEPLKEEQHA